MVELSSVRLMGRHSETEVLDELVEAVSGGESRVLVVRGDPGAGKTALLEYMAEQASGCRVVRAAGVNRRWSLRSLGCI